MVGIFCPILSYADDLLDVAENPEILEYNRLHDTGKYAEFLRKILLEVKRKADACGVENIINTANGEVPSVH